MSNQCCNLLPVLPCKVHIYNSVMLIAAVRRQHDPEQQAGTLCLAPAALTCARSRSLY